MGPYFKRVGQLKFPALLVYCKIIEMILWIK